MAEQRFHINPETGKPNICRARKPENCRYFGEDHYDSREEAQAAYERSQETELLGEPKRKGADGPSEDRRALTASPEDLNERGYLKEHVAAQAAPLGVFCANCGRPVDHRQASNLINDEWSYCECGARYDFDGVKVELPEDSPSRKFLDSKDEVLKATWYHATDKANWLEEINTDWGHFEVHMGTEAAAFDRALAEYASHQSWGKDFILYEVELDPSATVADEVAQDENSSVLRGKKEDVVRYINLWEDMASVSLAVNHEKVRIKSSRPVTKDEAHRRISIYNVDPDVETDEGAMALDELRRSKYTGGD